MLIFIFLFTHLALSKTLYYEAFTSTDFTTSEGWTLRNHLGIYSDCSGERILGGYNIFGVGAQAMILLQLPPHYQIDISFKFWRIDSWDGENFYVYIDQILSLDQFYQVGSGQNFCGIGWNDSYETITINQTHDYQSVYILLTSNLDYTPDDESWGFRDFKLYVHLCPPVCTQCEENDSYWECIPWILLNSAFLSITSAGFNDEGWTITGGTQSTSLCANVPLYGGYGLTGQLSQIKQTYDLPSHFMLMIKFRIAFIDTLSSEYTQLYVDGHLEYQRMEISDPVVTYKDKWGLGSNDQFSTATIIIYHSAEKVNLVFTSNLNSPDLEFFGFRDIQIFTIQMSFCGNSITELEELCDDGNIYPFDGCFNCEYSCVEGCSNQCQQEWQFETLNNNCVPQSEDQKIVQQEICDDGNIYPFDGCCNYQFQCSIDCLICLTGVCYKFKRVENHYYLDIQKNQIDFQQFDNFQFLCNQNCVQCQYGLCLDCQQGYILNNNQCFIICNHLNYEYDEYCLLQSYLPHQFDIQQYKEYQEGCLQQLNGYCILCQQGWIFDFHTQKCKVICGDLNINGNEECDILFKLPQLYDYGCYECNYKCQNVCDQCEYGKCYKCIQGWILQNFKCISVCGDGILVEGEIWDDGNEIQYDGCYNCQYECHHQCKICSQGQCYECNDGYAFVDNTCVAKCGDGVLDLKREKCDDKNQLPNDGCYQCKLQDGFYCYHENLKFQYCQRCQDINCLQCQIVKDKDVQECTLCQNGYFVDSYNQCSKCDQICKQCSKSFKNCTEYNFDYYQAKQCDNKLGYYYDFKKRDCISKCGDGMISNQEQCDDSNIQIYDSCNQFCQIEQGYLIYKNNQTLTKEPKLEVQIQYKQGIQFQITSNYSFQVLNCSSAQLIIQKFNVSFYNYSVYDSKNSCDFIINANKTIETYNLIQVAIKYYNQYSKTRLLEENFQEIIITPQRQVYVSEEQKQQGEATATTSSQVISGIFFAAPIILVFGGFQLIWPILDILNWINNFYFLNVNYPENVRLLFKNFEWASFLDIPQINLLNQEGCDYYFYPKEKFYEKGVDPLFLNGIQKVISLLLQVVGIKLLCFIFIILINKIYKIRKQSENVKKVSIFNMRNLSQTKSQIDKKQQIDEPTYIIKIPPFLKKLFNRCQQFYFYFVANIIKTLQLSFLDLTFAILLQLSNQQTSNHLIVQINNFISYFSILIIFYLLNKSYQISQLHVQQLNCTQYKRHFSCFYEGMKINSKLAMSYSFLNLMRKLIFTISIVLLYDNPIYQTTLCFSVCFFNIIIYFTLNPFENKELYLFDFYVLKIYKN